MMMVMMIPMVIASMVTMVMTMMIAMVMAVMMTGRIGKVAVQVLFPPDLSSPHKPQQTCPNLQNHRPHQRFRLLS